MKQVTATLFLFALALGVTGCMSWTPGWQQLPPISPQEAPSSIVDQADRLFETAGDATRVREAIDAWERVLELDPHNHAALDATAEANILYGAAYAEGRDEKAVSYRAGIRAAERSMATNDDFRRLVESGASVGEAADLLGRDQMRAMLFWVTGVSYYFKECLGGPAKLVHFRWMLRTREVMERMLELDPEFENGTVLFSLAIYHIASPPGAGRDMELASEYFDRAIEAGPESMLIPWGRAKYLHVRTGDRDAFVRDLEWVLAQDPKTATSAYRWNVYFQADAREMLGR